MPSLNPFHHHKSNSNTASTPKMPQTATATLTSSHHILAQTTDFSTVEGNIYFPPSSIADKSIFSDSTLHTQCPWKGRASHYDISVDGKTIKNGAWFYPAPMDAAKGIKDYVAFCK